MNFPTLLFLFVIVPAALGLYGFLQARGNRVRSALLALAPIASGVVLWSACYAVAAAPLFDWNAGKIAPVVAMVRGQPQNYPLYQSPGDGVMTAWIYGPVPALLFLPAALFSRPTDVIMTGVAINALAVLLPVLCLHARLARSRSFAILSTVLVIAFCLQCESLRRAVFMITPDGPAIGLSVLSCAMLLGRRTTLHLIGSATCITLAVWCKQTIAPATIVAPIFLALVDGPRAAMKYVALLLAVFAIVSLVLIASFGWENLYFHMITIPRLHPWRDESRGKTFALIIGLRDLLFDGAPMSVALIVVAAIGGKTLRGLAIRSGWIMLPMTAIALVPGSVLGYVKVGGFLNNFAMTTLFILLAASVAASAIIREMKTIHAPTMVRAAICGAIIAYAVNIALVRRDLPAMASRISNPYANDQEIVYRFAVKHPQTGYFPWNNLSTLLAEGRLYHFEWGIRDRYDAGIQPTSGQVVDHLPARIRFIAFPDSAQSEFARNLFRLATREIKDDNLPGFVIYVPPEY
ncbi:hypothetical protein BH09PLA1_BH09PLA1_21570 [soil metagenome]